MAKEPVLNTRQFKFELVTPAKTELTGTEERVLLPGEEGDFMVMAGHTLLLAALRPGILSVIANDNKAVHYFVTGGLADIGNTHCTVLTPHVTAVDKLNAEKLETELQEVLEELYSAQGHAQDHLRERAEMIRLQIDAVKKYAN